MINGVVVNRNGMQYMCMAIPDGKIGIKFKCGACSRGVIPTKIGELCAICGADVVAIDDGSRDRTVLVHDGLCLTNPHPAVSAFLAALRAASPIDREAMVEELRENCCVLCGDLDPECPCWEAEEEEPS
jgi:hypothetical protein